MIRTVMIIILTILLYNCGICGERFSIPYFAELDLTKKDIVIKDNGIEVKVIVKNRPFKPFVPIDLYFFVYKNGKEREVFSGEISYNMKMDMGNFKYKLLKTKNGYFNQAVLPKCVFRDRRWFGKVEFEIDGKKYKHIFIFDMEK